MLMDPHFTGAIYIVIVSLPRSDRFKEENVIVVGTIPGPNEPKQNIKYFVAPPVHRQLLVTQLSEQF